MLRSTEREREASQDNIAVRLWGPRERERERERDERGVVCARVCVCVAVQVDLELVVFLVNEPVQCTTVQESV